MDNDNILPALELPTLTIDFATLGQGQQQLDSDDEIVLFFDKKNIKKPDGDEEDGSKTASAVVDWRSHEKIRALFPHHKHDTLPLFVSHFAVEERSSFAADLLWRHIVPASSARGGKKGNNNGSSSPNGKDSGTDSAARSPTTSAQGQDFSRYQQQNSKKATQQTQASKKGQARGELGSAVAGAEKVNIGEDEYKTDWYAVLKVDESASESQIRSAFRRRCLETHPDKCQGSDAEFKQVQRAFEILGNGDARKQFDSSRDFDDSIPPDAMEFDAAHSGEFYAMFAPVFNRNARWSAVPVTAQLGDDSTPLADVHRFYDFWLGFRSWRDFSHVAELEEISEGMPREEKRFYQRENERILAQLKKQEVKRVRELVDRAMAADPRLRIEQRKAAEEKEAAKRGREEALLAAKHERERAEKEAAEREAAAKQAAKDAELRARQLQRDSKASVVDTLREKRLLNEEEASSKGLQDTAVRIANVDWLFGKLQPGKDPQQLAQTILGAADIVAGFNKLLLGLERSLGKTRYGEPCAKEVPPSAAAAAAAAASVAKKATSSPSSSGAAAASSPPAPPPATAHWSEEDVVILTKASIKFPRGTVDRWRRIASVPEFKDRYSEEQVLAKVKELEHSAVSGAGKKSVSSPLPGVAESSGAPPAASESAPSGASASSSAAATGSGAAVVTVSPGASASVAAAAAAEEDWTVKQQQQLEDGLRAMKDYKEKDKFVKVAEFVTDKSARQCFERFQQLRALSVKAKK